LPFLIHFYPHLKSGSFSPEKILEDFVLSNLIQPPYHLTIDSAFPSENIFKLIFNKNIFLTTSCKKTKFGYVWELLSENLSNKQQKASFNNYGLFSIKNDGEDMVRVISNYFKIIDKKTKKVISPIFIESSISNTQPINDSGLNPNLNTPSQISQTDKTSSNLNINLTSTP